MTILPQQDAEIRKRLKSWLWRNGIAFVNFGLVVGFPSSLFAVAKGIPQWMAWPVGIGGGMTLGMYAAFRWSKRYTRKLAQYRIVIEGDTFRVKGMVKGGMQEVRFAMVDVRCVLAGVVSRPVLVGSHPLICDLDSHALTIVEKGGASISFVWVLSIFSMQDLKAFFDHLRSRDIEAPIVTP